MYKISHSHKVNSLWSNVCYTFTSVLNGMQKIEPDMYHLYVNIHVHSILWYITFRMSGGVSDIYPLITFRMSGIVTDIYIHYYTYTA